MAFEPLVEKLEAFGWYMQRIDGNDIDAVKAAFDNARNHPEAKPRIIVCDTRMGCGVPFLEEREKNHFIRVDPHEWQLALAALEAGRTSMSDTVIGKKPRLKTSAMIASIAGEGQVTRSAPFGHALVELARERPKWSA